MKVRFGRHRVHHGPPALLGAVFARHWWHRALCVAWLLSDVHDMRRWLPDLIREKR